MLVTRHQVAEKLREWESGHLSAADIKSWVDSLLYPDLDYEDWEGDEDNSVTNEVLGRLDQMEANVIVAEDVPIYLRFLETPIGQFAIAYRELEEALSLIDYPTRVQRLRDVEPYSNVIR